MIKYNDNWALRRMGKYINSLTLDLQTVKRKLDVNQNFVLISKAAFI